MEVGQIFHNNPVGLDASDFVYALVVDIRNEIARVYWNVNQKPWKGAGLGDIGGGVDPWSDEWRTLSYETGIPGIEWRPYYNWGGAPDDADWDQAEADKPNFSFEGVEVRWYKRFGRSMNVNVCWPAEKWQHWFGRCKQTIYAYESRHTKGPVMGHPIAYPDPAGVVLLDPTQEDLRFVGLLAAVDKLQAQLNCIACVCINVAEGKPPVFEKEDWRWCQELEWVVKLGLHALKAEGKFSLHDSSDD